MQAPFSFFIFSLEIGGWDFHSEFAVNSSLSFFTGIAKNPFVSSESCESFLFSPALTF